MKQGKERTAKWSNEKNNAPQRTEKLPQWIHQPRKKERTFPEENKTPNSLVLFTYMSARNSPETRQQWRRPPHPNVWAEVFRSTWWHFCTISAVQKGRLFVTARNPKDHYCWILWSEIEKCSLRSSTYRRKRSSEVSHRRKTAETQLRNGRIKERPVKTMEWFKKNERQPASTKLFIQMINFYVSNCS